MKPDLIGGEEFVEYPWIIPIAKGNSFVRMINLAEEMEQDVLGYGDLILQLATCQEISLYKEIIDRKAVITAHDGHLANLRNKKDQAEEEYLEEVEKFKSMDCEGSLPPEQYELCLAQQALVEDKFAAYEELVNTFNQVIGLRNFEVELMNQAVDTFNNLMDAKDQSCAVVFSERIETQEEEEEGP